LRLRQEWGSVDQRRSLNEQSGYYEENTSVVIILAHGLEYDVEVGLTVTHPTARHQYEDQTIAVRWHRFVPQHPLFGRYWQDVPSFCEAQKRQVTR
jgi:hypothetical protein